MLIVFANSFMTAAGYTAAGYRHREQRDAQNVRHGMEPRRKWRLWLGRS